MRNIHCEEITRESEATEDFYCAKCLKVTKWKHTASTYHHEHYMCCECQTPATSQQIVKAWDQLKTDAENVMRVEAFKKLSLGEQLPIIYSMILNAKVSR